MSKTSAPYLLKKFKTKSPFWYYKLRGWDSYKSTKKRSYIKAVEWVESEILNKRPKQIDPTIAEYCENFFIPGKCKWVVRQSLRGNELKQSTIHWRRRMLENHVLPNFGHYRFHEITPQIIEYTIALFPLSSRTKAIIFETLMIIIKEARREQLLHFEIDKLSEKPKIFTKETATIDERLVPYLFPKDRKLFLKLWESPGQGVMCIIMYSAGLRISEVRALSYEAIHQKYKGIKVLRTIDTDEKISIPKAKSIRVVPIPTNTLKLINWWVKYSKYNGGLLFPGKDGGPLDRQSTSHRIKTALNKLKRDYPKLEGLSSAHITPHVLRHSYNTKVRLILANAGIESLWDDESKKYSMGTLADSILRSFTGHRTKEMTELYYHPDFEAHLKFFNERLGPYIEKIY